MSEPVILTYLKTMNEYRASDLYLTVGFPPTLRGSDGMMRIADAPLTIDDVNDVLNVILTSRQRREFDNSKELNSALDMGQHGRFRLNVCQQRQSPALVIRRIIMKIPTFNMLKLPKVLENLSMERRGLVLVTGMTGSGKSTTLAAMINHRNENEAGHIITIEDPIEYFHEHKKAVVTQREVGVDTESFQVAMQNALRQRPDVLLVGEIRDQDTMQQALTISETGHLCLATLHTNNAYQAIERMVSFFPEEAYSQVRASLSMNLVAIVSQRLVPAEQGGVVPAIEVMLNQGLIRELIAKGEISKIVDVMEQSNSMGMCSYDQSLLRLYEEYLISEETAVMYSDKATDMKVKLHQMQMSSKTGRRVTGLQSVDTSLLSLSD